MISWSSSFASSTPATSLNVIFFPWAEVSFARDLPNDMALFPPDCICRMKMIHTTTRIRMGDHMKIMDKSELSAGFLALTTTPLSRSVFMSASSLTV